VAVLYSTWAVLRANGADEPLWKYLILGVAGLSFLLHTRLIDELRDRDVDVNAEDEDDEYTDKAEDE
jgi:hypothetical protein